MTGKDLSFKSQKVQSKHHTYYSFYGGILPVILILLGHTLLTQIQFILTCMLKTLKLFQCCGLKTSLLVCDGSPANLATIKATHGHVGAYSVLPDSTSGDKFAVKPFMINPFDPPNRIYWVVCPTHQVCFNMQLCCVCVYFVSMYVAQEYD